eukprot:TRINITY_DN28099_c0_g1_i1.p1 TRINITY_DN28099_c0_g1~~TRINITY_DN28099_c0_g1_i1.p1  ORF type:complete len:147 (+),score=15.57 TRINITY_DN28099_c0_g1_i1:58-498(+)
MSAKFLDPASVDWRRLKDLFMLPSSGDMEPPSVGDSVVGEGRSKVSTDAFLPPDAFFFFSSLFFFLAATAGGSEGLRSLTPWGASILSLKLSSSITMGISEKDCLVGAFSLASFLVVDDVAPAVFELDGVDAVSYTHLTLPTKRIV